MNSPPSPVIANAAAVFEALAKISDTKPTPATVKWKPNSFLKIAKLIEVTRYNI